jgi:hypothetical protein
VVLKKYFILMLSIFFLIGCSDNFVDEVEIGEAHPWERESARAFWYTLVYQNKDSLRVTTLPIGSRKALVEVPKTGAIVFVAYPLGEGLPLGAALEATGLNKKLKLDSELGSLGETLLYVAKTWPKCVQSINWEKICKEVLCVDDKGLAIQWNRLANDLVNGKLSSLSFQKGVTRDLVLEDIPSGKWVCEIKGFGSFVVYKDEAVVLKELPVGLLRFLNLQRKLVLKIFISEDENEDPYYYIGPCDSLLTIADSDYYELLN